MENPFFLKIEEDIKKGSCHSTQLILDERSRLFEKMEETSAFAMLHDIKRMCCALK
jgi:hypothetical protein